MCATLKNLKANVEKLVPFAAANSVDQFDAMQQSRSEVEILNKSLHDTKAEYDHKIASMDWNLHQLQNRNKLLEQQLYKKPQEITKEVKLLSKLSVNSYIVIWLYSMLALF